MFWNTTFFMTLHSVLWLFVSSLGRGRADGIVVSSHELQLGNVPVCDVCVSVTANKSRWVLLIGDQHTSSDGMIILGIA